MTDAAGRPVANLRSYTWRNSYKTSAVTGKGRPVDILYDFYIPVLKRSIRYDRIAGYFRSSSLAAASQGFSAFVGRGGKIRLIVGADLDPSDVQAILQGDAERLATGLNAQLAQRDTWPADVAKGVDLLAWMVAQGYLEVRVAFRVHAETGRPLPFSSVEDGYVHEKWAIFTDELGQRMYVSGSLNESKMALVHNAENIDIHCDWWGERDRERVEEAEADFQADWENLNPHLPVMDLPEAVRRRLIQIAEGVAFPTEIDGTSAAPKKVDPPSAAERLRFALIKDGPKLPGGRYVGLETAPIEPWPHQAVVARRLVETWPYNYLLCDEVGLGKTIEAGLAGRSLHLCGLVERILIAAPRALTRQWQREMATKFLMPFGRVLGGPTIKHHYEFPVEEDRPAASLYTPNLTIVSTGLLSRQERLPDLDHTTPFDIVLVDEAHYARRKNPVRGARVHAEYGNLFRAIREHLTTKTSCLWLATATPMQLDAVEVSDLLQFTDRVGAFQFDPTLMQQYYEILGKLVRHGTPSEEEWEFLRRAVAIVPQQDPRLWSFMESAVIDGRIRVAVRQWLEQGRAPRGADLRNMLRLIFAASPLSRTMLRHTRSLLEIYREQGRLSANLAKRTILPVPRIIFNDQEKQAYDDLESYCQELPQKVAEHADTETRNMIGFMLSCLRLRFASSLYAIRETLRRRRERVEATLRHLAPALAEFSADDEGWVTAEEDEDDEEIVASLLKNRSPEDLKWERKRLTEMLGNLEDLSATPSKMQRLLGVLQQRRIAGTGRIKQTVIFTRFFDTLTDIVRRLQRVDRHMLVGTYSGQGGQYTDPQTHRLVGVERDEVKHRFLRGEIDILVCTDAAAEGLNLQTADLLVNFDLPWNPMKVEQRIGRIDRIGQRHEQIFVLNLCYADSAEQIVYDRLLNRLVQAGSIVGTQQISMLPVTREEFLELAEGRLDEDELERRAKERIAQFQQRTASMEIPPRDLYDIYSRLAGDGSGTSSPVTLDGIWRTLSASRYLRDLGGVVAADPDRPVFHIRGIDGTPEKAVLTTNRALLDTGIPELEGRLHFASYGEPVFDAVLDHVGQHELPPSIRRLTASVEGVKAQMVGYAVATVDPEGTRHIQLLTSLDAVEGLQFDETTPLTDEEVEQPRRHLAEMARREFEPILVVRRLQRVNRQAGHAQCALNYLVIARRLELRQGFSKEGTMFWPLMEELEQHTTDRDRITVPGLPAAPMRDLLPHLLFPAQVPRIGTEATITAPLPLLRSSFDAGCRVADLLKVKKSELQTDTVLARLRRELERELAALRS